MIRGLLRFAFVWALSVYLTPYISRILDRIAQRAPEGSFLEETLLELNNSYTATLIRSVGETIGELALGSKRRR